MKETQITITIKEGGEATVIQNIATGQAETPENELAAVVGEFDSGAPMSESEAQRYAVASDLANVCEYLEDSEVIKIRLIISKAQARKERIEGGTE